MATVTLRVDDRTKEDLDALARSRGTTITDLLRPLIDELTGRATKEPGAHPVHLTLVERRILSMQHAILARLDPGLEDVHRLRSEALDNGFAGAYSEEFLGVDAELSARDCDMSMTSSTCSRSSAPVWTGWIPPGSPASARTPWGTWRSAASTVTTRSRAGCWLTPST